MAENLALYDALKEELIGLEKVLAVLQQEREILTRARIDQLAGITDQKATLVAELEALSAKRRNQMIALGIPDDGSAIADWLAVHAPATLSLWQTLTDLARQAAQFNSGNGQLLACREEANRNLMRVLVTEQDTENSYNADGRIQHSAPRRPLDRA